jgi:hypothetical protein
MQQRMQEHGDSMSNVIGLPRDRILLREVAKRNRLPHRQRILRRSSGKNLRWLSSENYSAHHDEAEQRI